MPTASTDLAKCVHQLAQLTEVCAAIDSRQLAGDNLEFGAWLDAFACPPGTLHEPKPDDWPVSLSRLVPSAGTITWHVVGSDIVGLPTDGASRTEAYCIPVAALGLMPGIRTVGPL